MSQRQRRGQADLHLSGITARLHPVRGDMFIALPIPASGAVRRSGDMFVFQRDVHSAPPNGAGR